VVIINSEEIHAKLSESIVLYVNFIYIQNERLIIVYVSATACKGRRIAK